VKSTVNPRKERNAAYLKRTSTGDKASSANIIIFSNISEAEETRFPSSKVEREKLLQAKVNEGCLVHVPHFTENTLVKQIKKALMAIEFNGFFRFACSGQNPNGKIPAYIFTSSKLYSSANAPSAEALEDMPVFRIKNRPPYFAIIMEEEAVEDKQPEKRKSSSTAKLSSKREVTKIILSSDSEDDDDDTKPLPTTSKKEASTKRQITKLTSDLVDKEPTYEMSFGDEESNAEVPKKIRKLSEEGISKTLTLTSYYVLLTH